MGNAAFSNSLERTLPLEALENLGKVKTITLFRREEIWDISVQIK
jgi:hypothetical protein